MPNPNHSAGATKRILKASPFVDADGNVDKWELEVQYSLNGWQHTFRHEYQPDAPKAPDVFTRAELLAECPTAKWDMVFDSQYESVKGEAARTAPQRRDFDVRSLR